MWTTLLVLAIAVNFEPTRLGLVVFILVRPRPIPQLIAFLAGSFVTSVSAGLVVLLVLHHGVAAGSRFNGSKVQIAVGLIAMSIAVLLACNIAGRHAKKQPSPVPIPTFLVNNTDTPSQAFSESRFAVWLSSRAGRLVRGNSPWFAGLLGVGLALPSPDYLALLVLIATSGMDYTSQIFALLGFLSLANSVVIVPIICYLIAPGSTRMTLLRLRDWVLARRRRDYAILFFVAGAMMVGVGIGGL